MRQALPILDREGEGIAAAYLQHAIDIVTGTSFLSTDDSAASECLLDEVAAA